ncbi:hypothetical protein ACFPM0_16490 [Pseudonocardia sulfidoxydans]|uniref:hypothetical protein n=1 Tax=Pseudonocardia sulfidoxydans TaxID=54011 RepID=UPI003606EE2F
MTVNSPPSVIVGAVPATRIPLRAVRLVARPGTCRSWRSRWAGGRGRDAVDRWSARDEERLGRRNDRIVSSTSIITSSIPV